MDQKAIEDEARLQAIEYLLRHLLTAHFLRAPDPIAAVKATIANIGGTLGVETYGADPALSDHISAEIEAAVEVQVSGVLQHPAMVRLQSGDQSQ